MSMNTSPHRIELDHDVYRYLLSQTEYVGESISAILRKLLDIKPPFSADMVPPVSSVERWEALEALLEIPKEPNVIQRFLLILSALYQCDPFLFCRTVTTINGRKRKYFAYSEAEIAESGRETKPCLIPDTPVWVLTNSTSERKRLVIEKVFLEMEVPELIREKMRTYLS